MRICVLASGSEGNSTYVEVGSHKIFLDLGMNLKYISSKLGELDITPNEIDSVFISHVHNDHIGCLENFIKKYDPKIYMSKVMFDELPAESLVRQYNNIEFFSDDFILDNIKIELVKTSHDTNDSRGFIITYEDNSVVYITDTGYLNQKFFNKLKDKTVYLFESNHDVEMLINGKYPKWLKDRVVGPYGHLSNKDASIYLSKLIGSNTKKIMLMHLSKENNTPECALNTIYEIFDEYNVEFNNIDCAKQREKSEVINI
ncbi:MAG: MBL fold metallo-hydrolase [Bacilli bacterium]|nr:MBL fold metallo-hydrolase [Bacilli bacterium]